MATTLWPVDVANSQTMTGYTSATLQLATSAGSAQVNRSATTTASGNHIEIVVSLNPMCWVYQVDAVTISSTISFNVWCFEDAMATNSQPACRLARFTSAGSFVSDIVADANANHADGVEAGTSVALQTWSATPTTTSLSSGDYLVAVFHADAIGTMAAGTFTLSWNGPTAAANGDTFITFNDTIPAFGSGGAAQVPYTNRMRSLLAQ